jgi:hypothetical protein
MQNFLGASNTPDKPSRKNSGDEESLTADTESFVIKQEESNKAILR